MKELGKSLLRWPQAILPARGNSLLAPHQSKHLSSASPDDSELETLGLRKSETLIPRHIPTPQGGKEDNFRLRVGGMEP